MLAIKSSLVFFVVVFGPLVNAQHLSGNAPNALSGSNITDHMMIMDAKRSLDGAPAEVVVGSPYLNQEFIPATVVSTKGRFTDVPMRYDIYNGYMEFKSKGATMILMTGTDIQKIQLDGRTFVVENLTVKGKIQPTYFERLDSGKFTLLSKQVISYRPAQPPKAIETEGRPARYDRAADDYYYKSATTGPVEISSIKKMLEAFTDHQQELQDFVKKEKISKKEQDLTRLFKYYNSLN